MGWEREVEEKIRGTKMRRKKGGKKKLRGKGGMEGWR